MCVSEIRVKQIRVNQGLGVLTLYTTVHSETAYFIPFGFLILFFHFMHRDKIWSAESAQNLQYRIGEE